MKYENIFAVCSYQMVGTLRNSGIDEKDIRVVANFYSEQ